MLRFIVSLMKKFMNGLFRIPMKSLMGYFTKSLDKRSPKKIIIVEYNRPPNVAKNKFCKGCGLIFDKSDDCKKHRRTCDAFIALNISEHFNIPMHPRSPRESELEPGLDLEPELELQTFNAIEGDRLRALAICAKRSTHILNPEVYVTNETESEMATIEELEEEVTENWEKYKTEVETIKKSIEELADCPAAREGKSYDKDDIPVLIDLLVETTRKYYAYPE